MKDKEPVLRQALSSLLGETTSGDPELPLRWTCKSTRRLAAELKSQHHIVSHVKVSQLLKEDGYSLQGNRKPKESGEHPDRDAQFRHIGRRVRQTLACGQPVISVDTKIKKMAGNHQNRGRQRLAEGQPHQVNVRDLPDPPIPRPYPYGIYDIGSHKGCVHIETNYDAASFAAASIRGWWRQIGSHEYPRARRLLIAADGDASNGYRRRQWKLELQKLSEETGFRIRVCHIPPGIRKWNEREHRLFSFISSNWRGEPSRDYETVVNLIGSATVKSHSLCCRLEHGQYPTGRMATKREMWEVRLVPVKFQSKWNYRIAPMGIM